MSYWRTDMDGHAGEHLGLFVEVAPDGSILTCFGLSVDLDLGDFEHTRLFTPADANGNPISKLDPDWGWKQISPEEYEEAVEAKRLIFERDALYERRALRQRCMKCMGAGRMLATGTPCPDCGGTGKVGQPGGAEGQERPLIWMPS